MMADPVRAGRARGLIVAAPASGSGKTVVTLGLARAFRRTGLAVATFKSGPDYIDPDFLAAASGRPCHNIDLWAMRPATAAALAIGLEQSADLVLGEGAMGLFDGAADGSGSTADLAALTGWPILLVIDVRRQAASVAALLRGFASHRPDIRVAGAIFNRVGGDSHDAVLRRAVAPLGIPVIGCLPRDAGLDLPARHLGLVQAGERHDLAAFLDRAADRILRGIDLAAVQALAAPGRMSMSAEPADPVLPPLGQRIAVAADAAFSFSYPALLDGWRRAGAEVAPFSPLADDPPPPADAIYLPGGYPELHAGRVAAAGRFLEGLRKAAAQGTTVFGECGGYMVLGSGLVDAEGVRHAMADLLPLETSMAARPHLGYRRAELVESGPLGRTGDSFRGHEFHYAAVEREGAADPLFRCRDAMGRDLGPCGRRIGRVFASFIHLIDREAVGAGAVAAA